MTSEDTTTQVPVELATRSPVAPTGGGAPPERGHVQTSAVFSADRLYRYALRRSWSGGPVVSFVMLNPSTADEAADDPTIRRCIGFARAAGCGGLVVVNLCAWRSADPTDLRAAADPVGPDNHRWLAWTLAQPGPVVVAWGARAERRRVSAVLELVGHRELQCLGVTAHGQPRHPLYVRADTPLRPWPTARSIMRPAPASGELADER